MIEADVGLEAVRSTIDSKCRAILAALEDLRDLIGGPLPAYVVDLRASKEVTVYVVTNKWLHVFRGPPDPPLPVHARESVDPRFPTGCKYHAVRITSDATVEYAFRANARQLADGQQPPADPFTDVVRRWTFHVGAEKLDIEMPDADRSQPEQVEYARFADMLAGVITDAGARSMTPMSRG